MDQWDLKMGNIRCGLRPRWKLEPAETTYQGSFFDVFGASRAGLCVSIPLQGSELRFFLSLQIAHYKQK